MGIRNIKETTSNMYSKVRILVHQPVTQRLYEDFFVEKLIREEIEVFFYDLTKLFHKNLEVVGVLENANVIKFDNILEFHNTLKRERGQSILYIPYFIYEYKVLSIYRLLSKYAYKTAFMGRGALPSPNIKKNYLQMAMGNFFSLFDVKVLKKGFSKVYVSYLKKVGRIRKFDIIFNAGNNGHFTCGTSFEILYAQVVPFNSVDYSRYLISLHNESRLIEGKFAVFLDEYLPFHPDIEMLGLKSVNADRYFASLNKFFNLIERKYNIVVIIAAHPKSNYKENPFQGRTLIKNQTENLIKDAEFVIDHFSTAISYAVLNNKPLLLIFTNDIYETFPKLVAYAKNVSLTLGVSLINIDEQPSDFQLNVNTEKYTTYKYDYLTMPEAELKYDHAIFIDFLKGVNDQK